VAWHPLELDSPVFEQAWHFQDRHKVAFSDALILGAAQVGGCGYLLTADLQNKQELAGIRIVNPFRSLPNALG
jgi:predicted nucleic acid-binding protein